jgi:hypothetical protein
MRMVAVVAVFMVGAFLAQGDAADAQQVRYSTGTSTARFDVPTPAGATVPSTHRDVSSNHPSERSAPRWTAHPSVPGCPTYSLLERLTTPPADQVASPHPPRLASDRAPPSSVS